MHVRNVRTTCTISTKQHHLAQQNSTLLKEINKITSKHDQLDKIHASLEADCVKFVKMAESKMDLSYISKANALRGKAVDVKNDIKEMTETLSMLQEN